MLQEKITRKEVEEKNKLCQQQIEFCELSKKVPDADIKRWNESVEMWQDSLSYWQNKLLEMEE